MTETTTIISTETTNFINMNVRLSTTKTDLLVWSFSFVWREILCHFVCCVKYLTHTVLWHRLRQQLCDCVFSLRSSIPNQTKTPAIRKGERRSCRQQHNFHPPHPYHYTSPDPSTTTPDRFYPSIWPPDVPRERLEFPSLPKDIRHTHLLWAREWQQHKISHIYKEVYEILCMREATRHKICVIPPLRDASKSLLIGCQPAREYKWGEDHQTLQKVRPSIWYFILSDLHETPPYMFHVNVWCVV